MKIGITGASGLLGTALSEALRERGDSVIPFVRSSQTPSEPVIRWFPDRHEVDERDLASVGHLDAIVHLAGAGIADQRWTTKRKTDILSSRVDGTALLLQVAHGLTSPPTVVLSGSAIGYYGTRGDDILTEESSRGDGYLADVCVAWEDAALPLQALGTKVSWLRTGIVMSPRGGALKKQLPLFRAGAGGQLGNGRQWLSPISLRDHVRATLFILDNQLAGPINLTAPEPVTNKEFTKSLARQLHRPALASIPQWAVAIGLGSELTREALFASQRVVPTALTEQGFTFESPDIATILASELAR